MQNAIIYMVFLTWPPTKLLPIVEGNIRLLVLVYLIIRNKWKSAVISVKVGLSTSNCVGGELESGSWRPLHFFLLFFLLPYCFSLLPFCLCLLSSISSFLPSLPCSCSRRSSYDTEATVKPVEECAKDVWIKENIGWEKRGGRWREKRRCEESSVKIKCALVLTFLLY